ncbi:MAG TPA: M3 family metallopeptidase [Candidatus Limnocylindrales bacterium]
MTTGAKAPVEFGEPGWDEPSLDIPTPTPDALRALTSAALDRANARIDAAVALANPSFEDLFGALDDAAREVAIAFGQGAQLAMVASDDAVRDAAFAANEQIEAWRGALSMRDDLVAAIERFVARTDLDRLTALERRYLDRWQRDIRLAGGELPAADREAMARITSRLLELGSQFMGNLAKPPHIVASRAELAGAPATVLAAAAPIEGDADHVDLELNGGLYLPVMEQTPNRALRERAYRAWLSRGVPDNLPLLREAFELRRRLAALAGYPSWQAYRVENFAAPSAAFINEFVEDLAARLRATGDHQRAQMLRVLRAEPGMPADLVLQDWDWRYADAKLRDEIGADQDRLAEYFELERVLDGLATLSAEVFGIRLEPVSGRTAWDPEVRAFDLVEVDSGTVICHLYVDLWARSGKQGGAWCETLLPGGGRRGEGLPPTMQLVLNVSAPAEGPTLLGAVDVETIFHEYGHVMNFACGRSAYVLNRGTWYPNDFIEGPSEFLGRWALQPEVVARFARHHLTGEPIPAELVEAVARSEALTTSFDVLRILAQARFDGLMHGETAMPMEDAQRDAWSLRGLPFVEGTFLPASLTHILGLPYDAAIYGYVWSEVIRDDLLDRFEAGGLLAREMGERYRRTILDVSWMDDAVAAVDAFLGRPWSADAFLRRATG